jgi:heat shock protein HslJ
VVTSCLGQEPVLGTTLTVSFSDGQVRGSSGCNTYFGSYRVSGSRIDVEQLASTKMACQEPGVMQQEGAFLASLREVYTYRLEEGRLELVRPDGQTLVFKPGE